MKSNKLTLRSLPQVLILLLAGLFVSQVAMAQTTFNWTGASGTDTNWSTIANWDNGSATPGSADTAIFGATATVANSTNINNVVNSSTTVTALTYNQTALSAWHVTKIPTGNTLTVSGAMTVGGGTANSITSSVAMTGGGTLVVNGGLTVGNNGSSSVVTGTILDLSGINNFIFNNSGVNLQISSGGRSGANMNFAAVSNSVTASNVNFDNASISSAANGGLVNLGSGTNIFNVGNLFVTAYARNTCTLQFPSGSGGLRLRGPSGADTDPCPIYQVGYRANFNSTSGGSSAGTNNFFGHPVDILVNQMTVGRESVGGQTVGGTASTGTGVLNFGPGTIKVNTEIEIGRATSQGPQASAVGILNISGGTLIYAGTGANSSTAGFNLGYDPGTSITAGTSTAFLNVTNGSVISSNNILRQYASGFGNGSSSISLIRSSMLVAGGGLIGLPAVPINNLTIADSVLSLAVPLNSTNVCVTTLNNASTTNNTINILSLPTISHYPTTYPLIVFSSGAPGNFVLGTLPTASPAYQGFLATNANSVSFVLTNGPAPAVQTLVWNGNVSGNWDTATVNWQGGLFYNQTDLVTFDDTLSGTTNVNLTTSMTPGSLTVSNNTTPYVFSGSGSIASITSGGLIKNGSNILVLANSSANTFSGGVSINGGKLQLSTFDNRLPTSTTVSLANVTNATLDLNDRNQTVSAVTGGGTNGGNVTFGSSGTNGLIITGGGAYFGKISGNGTLYKTSLGTETFYGANSYTGGTYIGGGVLVVANSSGSGTGTGFVDIEGGTLQIGDGFNSGSVSTAIVTNNGQLAFACTNNISFTNQIVGTGQIFQNGNNTTTIPTGNTNSTGNVTINSGILLATDPNALGNPSSVVINNGGSACLAVANNTYLNVPIQMYGKGVGNGPSLLNVSGTNTIPGGVFLSEGGQNWQLASASGRVIITGSWFNGATTGSRTMWLTGSGNGDFGSNLGNGSGSASTGLLKDGSGTWTLGGAYTYTDFTTVSNGTLLVTGDVVYSTVRVRGGTLGGTGNFYQPVTVNSGGALAPGVDGIGTLNVASDLTLSGTCNMEIDGTSVTSDQVTVSGALNQGGTLNVTLTGAVSVGNSFTLFTAGTFAGQFAATNLPTLTGGLAWDTSNLGSGILAVVVSSGPPTLNVIQTGSSLNFSWTGTYKLQSQTNALNIGLNSNWGDYPGGGSSPVNVTIDPTAPSVFFRLVTP